MTCSFCRKREAVKLCDMPVGKISYVGHPPRGMMLKARHVDYAWVGVPASVTVTCDTPICESCATEIYRGIDICPKCVKLVKTKSTFHWRDHK